MGQELQVVCSLSGKQGREKGQEVVAQLKMQASGQQRVWSGGAEDGGSQVHSPLSKDEAEGSVTWVDSGAAGTFTQCEEVRDREKGALHHRPSSTSWQ